MQESEIRGLVEPGFEPVAEAFQALFRDPAEVGAGCALYHRGLKVVDLVGGVADPESGAPYTGRSLQVIFSASKGLTSLCAHLLVQRGEIDYETRVADVWPEFAAERKSEITLRTLMSHRAGLQVIDPVLTREEALAGAPVVEALAAQRPLYEPGTEHGEHAITYGYLIGEVVRRITGRSLGRFFADEIAGPLALDTFIGLPAAELDRVATLVPTPTEDFQSGKLQALIDSVPDAAVRALMVRACEDNMKPRSLAIRAMTLNGALRPPAEGGSLYNKPEVLAAEIGSANGVTNAGSLARLYAACIGEVDGVRLLEDGTIEDAIREQSSGPDRILCIPVRYGTGFMLDHPQWKLSGPRAFGFWGAGGSFGFADPDREIGFSY